MNNDNIEEIEESYPNDFEEEDYCVQNFEDDYESTLKLKVEFKENIKLNEDSKKKMTKFKLLIYQKMLNILFSVIATKIKGHLKYVIGLIKLLKIKSIVKIDLKSNNEKYKVPNFYIKTLIKTADRKERLDKIKTKHESIKKLNSAKEVNKVDPKSAAAMKEYTSFVEKQKLEKRLREEKKKKELDELDKLTFAIGIHKNKLLRDSFQKLYANVELNRVFFKFMKTVCDRIQQINSVNFFIRLYKLKKEKREHREKLLDVSLKKFYEYNLRKRLFKLLTNHRKLSQKVNDFYLKNFQIKASKIKKKIAFNLLSTYFKEKQNQYSQYIIRYNIIFKERCKEIFYKSLKKMREEKIDEKLKDELTAKLRLKALNILNNNEI